DTAGRVDKFLSKYSTTGGKTVKRKPKTVIMKIKPLKKIKKAVPKHLPKKDFAKKSDATRSVKKETKPKDTAEK
ncbi:MAG: hypothetical protein COS68_00230, partial [Elusimicrobia bacterium CG06_land_8_20_14_3_00_38_11]